MALPPEATSSSSSIMTLIVIIITTTATVAGAAAADDDNAGYSNITVPSAAVAREQISTRRCVVYSVSMLMPRPAYCWKARWRVVVATRDVFRCILCASTILYAIVQLTDDER